MKPDIASATEKTLCTIQLWQDVLKAGDRMLGDSYRLVNGV